MRLTLQHRRRALQRAVRAALDALPLPDGSGPDVADDAPDLHETMADDQRLYRRYARNARRTALEMLLCAAGARGAGQDETALCCLLQAQGWIAMGHDHAANDAKIVSLLDAIDARRELAAEEAPCCVP